MGKVAPEDMPVRRLKPARSRAPGAISRRTGKKCTRCGEVHQDKYGNRGCSGHYRGGINKGKACKRPTMNGQSVCGEHGGKFPQNRKKAEMRIAWHNTEGEVAKLLAECDLPEQHPIDGLLEVVRHTGAMMRLLSTLVSQLDLDPGEVKVSIDDNGKEKRYTYDDKGLFGYNTAGDQATHVLVTMYGMWADRYSRACKLALDANIDERIVRNAEATTNAVYTAITRSLEKANLTPQQAADFSKTLADEMRKLVGPLDLGRGQTA